MRTVQLDEIAADVSVVGDVADVAAGLDSAGADVGAEASTSAFVAVGSVVAAT